MLFVVRPPLSVKMKLSQPKSCFTLEFFCDKVVLPQVFWFGEMPSALIFEKKKSTFYVFPKRVSNTLPRDSLAQ